MQWLHSDEYVKTGLSVVGPRATWEANGSKDTYQLAREEVKRYAALEPNHLEPERQAKLDEIVASLENQVT